MCCLLHEPRRVIRANGEHGRVQPGKRAADLLEALEVGGVAGVVDARAGALHHEAAPEHLVGVAQAAAAPVLGGDVVHASRGPPSWSPTSPAR